MTRKTVCTDPLIQYEIGDCMRLLSSLDDDSVDTVITDPPYSTGARDGTRKMRGSLIRTDTKAWFAFDKMTTRGFCHFMREVFLEASFKLKEGGCVLSFIDWRQSGNMMDVMESAGLILQNCIIWDKEHFGMGTNFRSQHEFIIMGSKGTPEFVRHDIGNVIQCKRRADTIHPTEKPVELIAKLISACVPKGGLVVDPFLGSGATLEACRICNVMGIGSEINPDYEPIIRKRAMADTPSLFSFCKEGA